MTTLDHSVTQGIQILVYADLNAAMTYLFSVFDLGPGDLIRDPAGVPMRGTVGAGDGETWLYPESSEFGLASPGLRRPPRRSWLMMSTPTTSGRVITVPHDQRR